MIFYLKQLYRSIKFGIGLGIYDFTEHVYEYRYKKEMQRRRVFNTGD